ncbi:MAG TPA: hypothetical protein VNA24_04115 [Hyalangium sp.]|nr:hypothetical protein [Hyalangium sp.]
MTDNFGGGAAGGNAREQVSVPAILLMVLGGLTIASALFGMVQYLMGSNTAQMDELLSNPQIPEGMKSVLAASNKLGIVGSLLQLALGGVTFLGGLKMKNLESFGLAMAASIIVIIPLFGSCCCCIGIPVGIWSLVVLNKPEVKSSFART